VAHVLWRSVVGESEQRWVHVVVLPVLLFFQQLISC
jgi:hypothetical protein